MFVWAMSQKQTFEQLKQWLCLTPIFNLPFLQQPFEIKTDASYYVVGPILSQHFHIVAYYSETLLDAVHKYPTYEK